MRVNVLIDSGSQASYISHEVAKCLPHPVEYRELVIHALGEDKVPNAYPIHSVAIKGKGKQSIELSLIELESILPPVNTMNWYKAADQFPQCNLQQYREGSFQVDILLGSDQMWKVLLNNITHKGALEKRNTCLGPVLSGPIHSTSQSKCVSLASKVNPCPPPSMDQVFFPGGLDENEVDRQFKVMIEKMNSEESDDFETDEAVLENFMSKIQVKDGKFQVPLLWNKSHPPLKSNIGLSKKWLSSLTKRLQDKGKFEDFSKEMNRMMKEDLFECVGELNDENSNIGHFIPTFYVERPGHPTTPLRIVFAANSGHPSLNACLNPGPSLIKNLASILRNFRTKRIGIIGDLRKAFNSIEILPEDRKFLQFLWYENNDPKGKILIFRCKIVQFGPNCSPFLLFASLLSLFSSVDSENTRQLADEFYSDNLLGGKNTEKDCIMYVKEAIEILATRNFNLRDCRSNSKSVNNALAQIGKLQDRRQISVLGLLWDTEKDTLTFQKLAPMTSSLTKRNILKFSASLYDPLGLLTFATAPCMAFLSKLWQDKLDWDSEIPEDLHAEWANLQSQAIAASETKIARFHEFNGNGAMNLVVFCDASVKIAAALAYLQQNQKTVLVGGKYKIFNDSKSKLTIPKKELTAMVLGAKLGSTLKNEYSKTFKTLKGHIFSDSAICLYQLIANKKQETFVSNRLSQIKEKTEGWTYYHVSTSENPADFPSRGKAPDGPDEINLYFSGPKWLQQNSFPAEWKNDSPVAKLITLAAGTSLSAPPSVYNLIDPQAHEKVQHIFHVTAFLLKVSNSGKTFNELLTKAELLWIKDTQKKFMEKEYHFLTSPGGRQPPLVTSLRLFLENGIIRAQGRLGKANIDYDSKCPIFLPAEAPFSKLMVKRIHEKNKHLGSQQLMATVRKQFWIPKLKSITNNVIKNCIKCRRVHSKPYNTAAAPDLQSERVNLTKPYDNVGLDYTGAISFKSKGTIQKGYILIIACMTTRHVHLQLVPDMSTKTFIQALRYHSAMYGTMKKISCDNALSFVSGDQELSEVSKHLKSKDTENHFREFGIKFEFIPKRSPWWGAHYERLIGILKNHLKRAIGRNLLTERDLTIFLAEIASVMNERPLTVLDNDLDSLNPLTPNQLVFGHSLHSMPYPHLEQTNDPDFQTPPHLQDLYSKRAEIRQNFLDRYYNEYLAELRKRHSQVKEKDLETTAKIGDVCLIHDEGPKKFWNLGLVTEIVQGQDGKTRMAHVKTANGMTNRALPKLYPLGVWHDLTDKPPSEQNKKDEKQGESEQTKRTTEKRQAAIRARSNIQAMLQDDDSENE